MANLFNEENFPQFTTLKQYIPIVERVHGKTHNEFYEVRKAFDLIYNKIKQDDATPYLAEEFARLRDVTNNYTVPIDVCESYETVYKLLSELDEIYQKQMIK